MGLFRRAHSRRSRKAGTTKKSRKLLCGLAALVISSGASVGVPVAMGDGNGNGHGSQQQSGGASGGQGPGGNGPPGQLAKQNGGQGNGGGPSAQSNGNGNGNGNGPNGNGPPGQLAKQTGGHGNASGNGNGNGHGHGRGPGGNGPPGQNGSGNQNQPGNPAQAGSGSPFNGQGPNGKGPPGQLKKQGAQRAARAATAGPGNSSFAPGHSQGSQGNNGGNGGGNGGNGGGSASNGSPNSGSVSSGHRRRPSIARSGIVIPVPRTTANQSVTPRQTPTSSAGASAPSASVGTGAGPLAISPTATAGPLTADGGTATANPGSLTGKLAPGTAQIGAQGKTTARRTGHAHHRIRITLKTIVPTLIAPAATVIQIISVIPTGVWIALGALFALALMAGAAALRSRHQVRLQAGEVAVVTAAALTDPLTGVLNRRGFLEAAERELDRARRYGHPLALAFVDIRGLKAVNDTEGHLAGDRLLKRVTTLLRESARTHDLVGRIGGDELAVLLAEQDADGAEAMTQRVRAQVPAYRSSLGLVTGWDVTIGTSAFPEDGDDLEQLLDAADRRLYRQRGIDLTT